MRIENVNNSSSVAVQESNKLLNMVRNGLRLHGAVIMRDNEETQEIIQKLQTQFGSENVKIHKSDSVKIEVLNFKRS